jgi:NAD(P)-dependent dehydrogenase (short-subunit alcohol dehydrogenase family)
MSRTPTAPFDINGRTVFITGAARGIGAATAERLHAKGANVALVGLEPERLEQLAVHLGERSAWFEADVTDYDALQRAVRGTLERFGALDVAVANAGIAYVGALATAPMEHVERTLAVNLLGVWRTDRAVIKHVIERKGYLLNIASLAAISHAPLMGPYAASKAGVEALSDVLRQETAPSGARVGCAYFGFIDTDLVRASFAQGPSQAIIGRTPGFLGNPIPLSRAVDAIERGMERRAARVWTPRWVGATLALRGLLQPLIERQTAADAQSLAEGLRLADPASGQVGKEDPLLGVAANVL